MPISLAMAAFWVAVVCCAVAQWFIVRGTVAALGAPSGSAAAHGSHRSLEIAWAVLPAILLAVTLAATWRAIRTERADADTAPQHTAPEHSAARGGEAVAT